MSKLQETIRMLDREAITDSSRGSKRSEDPRKSDNEKRILKGCQNLSIKIFRPKLDLMPNQQ